MGLLSKILLGSLTSYLISAPTLIISIAYGDDSGAGILFLLIAVIIGSIVAGALTKKASHGAFSGFVIVAILYVLLVLTGLLGGVLGFKVVAKLLWLAILYPLISVILLPLAMISGVVSAVVSRKLSKKKEERGEETSGTSEAGVVI